MTKLSSESLSRVLYLPHGGGPLPLLGDEGHRGLVAFLAQVTEELGEPSAILVVSAHWEEDEPTITSGDRPAIIYDYHGFPAEAYEVQYPAPGESRLARELRELMGASGIVARLDDRRGFDHGLFVPLKLMYPEARIPCLQLSLLKNLDPAEHIALGKSISALREKNVLVVGSGLSFHNMQALMSRGAGGDKRSDEFDRWLIETCTDEGISAAGRERRLVEWETAPYARFCHPREEHLLPLHVCYGVACGETPTARVVFNEELMGHRVTGLLW